MSILQILCMHNFKIKLCRQEAEVTKMSTTRQDKAQHRNYKSLNLVVVKLITVQVTTMPSQCRNGKIRYDLYNTRTDRSLVCIVHTVYM